jgi:predicted Fe-Mo cluster-binding NifX family protein
MTKVAIPIHNGKLSEYFGQCYQYEIYKIEGGEVVGKDIIKAPFRDISRLPDWASEQNITDIVAHRIDHIVISMFTEKKINLYLGVDINKSSLIIEDYLNGHLQSNEEIITELKS